MSDADTQPTQQSEKPSEKQEAPKRRRLGIGRAALEILRTEWKYVLVGLMILVGHFKYNLSLMYYVRQLANSQEEHVRLDRQREASAKVVKHHVDLGNALFGDGEMRGAESEFKEALKVDPTNLDAQRGLFKASIFDEVDDDTNTRVASPVVVLSRIRELVCEVQEAECVAKAGADERAKAERRVTCGTDEWRCVQQRQGRVALRGLEGAHARLLEGMALANVDPEASLAALREAVLLADGHQPEEAFAAPANAGEPTHLAAAYIRIGDYYLGEAETGSLGKAIAAYGMALRATPWNINALDSVGYALHRAGQLDAAREKFSYLGRLDDTLMIARADLGRTLRCLGTGTKDDKGDKAGALLDEAYSEQRQLVSLLSADPPPATRDTVSQWQYPVDGRTYDLHEKPAKVAYATCTACLTGHLRGKPDEIGSCQRAIADRALTNDQRQAVRDFLLVELEELMGLPTGNPALKARAETFKAALQKVR
jgi:tetratricopeptide (TPR) repeat protein